MDIPWFSSLQDAISSLYPGSSVFLLESKPVGGGCISSTSALSLSNGTTVFMKSNAPDFERMFRTEAGGLAELAHSPGAPRVPSVLCGGKEKDRSFLLLEYIKPGMKSASFSKDLGYSLARLHKNTRRIQCGLFENNYIGTSNQINTPVKNWIDFFRTNRLEYQLRMARNKGLADAKMTSLVTHVMDHLHEFLIPCDHGQASLLHGDLWSGNVLCDSEGKAVIIDPAVYFGHREADLAMTELFGGFDSDFYQSYNKIWPLEEGYSNRRDLYNLYHMLNHLNIFGNSYTESVLSIVRKYTR